jgi:hypothetical protein
MAIAPEFISAHNPKDGDTCLTSLMDGSPISGQEPRDLDLDQKKETPVKVKVEISGGEKISDNTGSKPNLRQAGVRPVLRSPAGVATLDG